MDRDKLKFESAVSQNFEYLERECGFRCTQQSPFLVRFESDSVVMDVYHDPKDYEVGIRFGRIGTKRMFSFRLFLHRFFPDKDAELGESLAGTPDNVQQVVRTLSEVFRAVGRNIIEGDNVTYQVMETVHWWDFRPEALEPNQ